MQTTERVLYKTCRYGALFGRGSHNKSRTDGDVEVTTCTPNLDRFVLYSIANIRVLGTAGGARGIADGNVSVPGEILTKKSAEIRLSGSLRLIPASERHLTYIPPFPAPSVFIKLFLPSFRRPDQRRIWFRSMELVRGSER